ncbi:cobalamin biosynthesis protein [Novosphingobium capsulatum]|uniref:cobalamin biosynthesis protein n=1 Tax=Novosphingobium capsulatum TaxID=13688 RepID=UPI000787E66E|nr:cobalamin biosynthesis protein [Novosphingobium capsulatum]WQD92391.1 cobalamin biosynthesis protein [Novosphingobium capsulatum]
MTKIVAGLGFRAGAPLGALRAAFALAQEGLPAATHLATAADKAPALAPLARALGLPLIPVAADAVQRCGTATQSAASLRTRCTGSLAEAAALAAAGPGARLLCPRQISPDRMATCAVAQGHAQETER